MDSVYYIKEETDESDYGIIKSTTVQCVEYFVMNELIDILSYQASDEKTDDDFENFLFLEWVSKQDKKFLLNS